MKYRPFACILLALVILGWARISNAQVTWNSVTLSWTTPGDDAMIGTASQFDLRYSTSAITAANFGAATRWSGTPTPVAPGTRQSATVTALQPGTLYYFAIKTGDEVPNWSGISNVISQTTSTAPDNVRPAPVSVAVSVVTDTTAQLAWVAVGDDSLTGTAFSYDIRYSTSLITNANWGSAIQSTGEPAPGAPTTPQTFVVRSLSRQVTYYFAMKTSDEAGNVSELSNVPFITTPDTMPPASITDLGVGFVWMGWHTAHAVLPRALELSRP